MGKRKCLGIVGVVTGAVLVVVVGIVGWVVVPNVVDDKVKDQTRLTNPDTFGKWENVEHPIQLRFYIYNVTNPDALNLHTGEKLIFEEKGPYVYTEKRGKTAFLSDDGDIANYFQKIEYFFDEQLSVGSDEDLFNIPNIPFISVAHMGGAAGPDYPKRDNIINSIRFMGMFGEKLIKENVPVRELLFEGWQLLDIYIGLGQESGNPDLIDGRFGLYENKNGSDDGLFNIRSGNNDPARFGKIIDWEGRKELTWYPTAGLRQGSLGHFCNRINGSDGSIFPPFITKETTLRIFNTEVCRSLWLNYESEYKFQDKVDAYRFSVPSELFQSPAENPNNECFCQVQSPYVASQCARGVNRIFGCKNGAPIVVSNPHFLDGSPVLSEAIEIAPANEAQHKTFIDVEPNSGVLLQASKKVQVNVELQPIPEFDQFENINFTAHTDEPSIFLPVFWAEEHVELSADSTQDLYDKLVKPMKSVDIARWILIAVGALLFVGGGISVATA